MVLLCITALGGVVFALSSNISTLIIGRAIIGIGVTSGMAVTFKAFSQYFSDDQLPFLNGLGLAAGGIGMMMGTWPVEMALGITDWRGIVLLISGMTALAGIVMLVSVPSKKLQPTGVTFKKQLLGLKSVLTSRQYWRFAPLLMISTGTYAGIQTLWAGPWLRDVVSFDRGETASTLLIVASTTVIAMPLGGLIARYLARFGITVMDFVIGCMIGFMAVLTVIAFQWLVFTKLVWLLFGFLGPMSLTSYAAINRKFPKNLTARVNASLTIMWMIGAFAVQTGIGIIVDLYPRTANGGYAAEGYQMAIGFLIVLQLAALIWYVIAGVIWYERIEPIENQQQKVTV